MKLREFLVSTAMMSFSFVSAEAVTPPLPSPLITEDKILGAAYYDTLNILSNPNECSDFFGGASAVETFNGLIAKVEKGYYPSSIGIKMSGPILTVFSMKTKRNYRLFDKVSINSNGPFYKRNISNSEATVPSIGRFGPSTKEARILMLLHELGHLVEGKGGNWLLPDGGRDDARSRNNTRKIEEVCGGQIKSLVKGDSAMNSVSGKQASK